MPSRKKIEKKKSQQKQTNKINYSNQRQFVHIVIDVVFVVVHLPFDSVVDRLSFSLEFALNVLFIYRFYALARSKTEKSHAGAKQQGKTTTMAYLHVSHSIRSHATCIRMSASASARTHTHTPTLRGGMEKCEKRLSMVKLAIYFRFRNHSESQDQFSADAIRTEVKKKKTAAAQRLHFGWLWLLFAHANGPMAEQR